MFTSVTILVQKASRGCWHHCALVHLGRQEGKTSTHNTLSVWVATASQPRNGISRILLHLKQTKEGKRERRKGMRRPPEPCQNHSPAPHRAHPHMHPPQDPSPRSSAVQWGSCGQRNLPLPRQQHITSFFSLFLPNSINLLTHSGIYSPKFFTYVRFFKVDPFWHQGS